MGSAFDGFTFSGGEPLFQYEFLLELIQELKGFHLCIETSGFAETDIFQMIISKLDFVIMDVKIADIKKHRQYTGAGNKKILNKLILLKQSSKPHLIRTPLIFGVTYTSENLVLIEKIIGVSAWEKLLCNLLTGAKQKMLGLVN